MTSAVSTLETHASKPLSSTPLIVPSYFNPISPFFNGYGRFARWRSDLGLPHPGTVENLQKEVKGDILSISVVNCIE